MRTLCPLVYAAWSAGLFLFGHSPAASAQTPSIRWFTPGEPVAVAPAMKLVGVIDGPKGTFAAFISLATGERRLVAREGRIAGASVESVGSDSVVLALDGTFSIDIGQVLVTFGRAASSETPETRALLDPIGLVYVTGSVQSVADGPGQVVLDDLRAGVRHTVVEGETVAGYTAVLVRPRAVIIAAAVDGGGITHATPPTEIPDLLAMTTLARERWITRWRSALESLPAAGQRDEREQMRSYWREQWQGSWGIAVAAVLTEGQQEALRSVLASYWR
jgi:hypothetical protein